MSLRSYLIIGSLTMLGGVFGCHAQTEEHSAISSLHVNRFVLATKVENREPQNVKENFSPADEHVWAFADFATHSPETITFIWTHNGQVHFEWSTQIAASPRFRTYTSVKALPGQWTVKIQDQSGKMLEEKSFEIHGTVDHSEEHRNSSETTAEQGTDSASKSSSKPKGVREALRSLQPTTEEAKASAQKEETKPATVPTGQPVDPVTKPSVEEKK